MPFQPSEPFRPHSHFHRLVQLVALLSLLLLFALPLAADDSASEAPQSSQTVEGLLELVNAEMTEDVILLWLETRGTEIAPPSAGELLELRNAGASDAILQKLLRLAAETDPVEADSKPAPEPSAVAPIRTEPTRPRRPGDRIPAGAGARTAPDPDCPGEPRGGWIH